MCMCHCVLKLCESYLCASNVGLTSFSPVHSTFILNECMYVSLSKLKAALHMTEENLKLAISIKRYILFVFEWRMQIVEQNNVFI